MDITINIQTVLDEIKKEVSHVADRAYASNGSALYDAINITSREEKLVRSYINDAAKQLLRRCSRFLRENIQLRYNNDPDWPESYVYDFVFGERRAINKAEPLTATMHAFVMQYALSKWYSLTSQSELSNKYSLEALESGRQIDELLYYKQPPRV